MAELADALDLGSSVPDVQVQVLLPAWNRIPKNAGKSSVLRDFSMDALPASEPRSAPDKRSRLDRHPR